MADVKKSLMLMGVLGIILLILVIIFSVALLVGTEFQKQICVNDGGTTNISQGTCVNTGNHSQGLQSLGYNATVTLISQIVLVVGFIGIVVITAIGAILIGMTRGFIKEGDL